MIETTHESLEEMRESFTQLPNHHMKLTGNGVVHEIKKAARECRFDRIDHRDRMYLIMHSTRLLAFSELIKEGDVLTYMVILSGSLVVIDVRHTWDIGY
jgi:hypothetical protein